MDDMSMPGIIIAMSASDMLMGMSQGIRAVSPKPSGLGIQPNGNSARKTIAATARLTAALRATENMGAKSTRTPVRSSSTP
ncbi:MAG: hypothetical protein J0H61_02080 [Alphaproteobacteria bacterium]|nr:hypothetical protein [Alphaproteobacteria bacterium]